MPEPSTSALRAVSDAVLAVASRLSVDDVLQGLVDEARVLGGARYSALGIPDGAGGFSRFLVAGMSDELIAAMGPLPRTHGMLGAMLVAPGPYRTDDIHTHPRFKGCWPRTPRSRSPTPDSTSTAASCRCSASATASRSSCTTSSARSCSRSCLARR